MRHADLVSGFLLLLGLVTAGDLREAVDAALVDLAEAETHMLARRFDDAMEALRLPVETLVNRKALLADLLKRDGYSPEAITDFENMVGAQFGLCSKFSHRIERGAQKRINPTLHAHEEDVLQVYAVTATALNSIARKSRRHEAPR